MCIFCVWACFSILFGDQMSALIIMSTEGPHKGSKTNVRVC